MIFEDHLRGESMQFEARLHRSRNGLFLKPACWAVSLACALLAASVRAQPVRLISPQVVDLGTVLDGQSIEGEIRFVNAGAGPLHIASVQSSCGCTAVLPHETDVSPNDTGVVGFILKTTGMHGLVRKAITVSFADPGVETLYATIQARVRAEIELRPSFIVFQGIPFKSGSVYADTMLVLNGSGRPLRILRIQADTDLIHTDFFPASIPPDGEARIRIILKPKKAEYVNATLTIETDSPSKPKTIAPVLIDVTE